MHLAKTKPTMSKPKMTRIEKRLTIIETDS